MLLKKLVYYYHLNIATRTSRLNVGHSTNDIVKMTTYDVSLDEMTIDNVSLDEMTIDNVSLDEMTIDKMTCCERNFSAIT